MKLVPWRFFNRWSCLACGDCCKRYYVSLSKSEAKYIKLRYGEDKLVELKGKYFLRRRSDGSCVFLKRHLCEIQKEKPLACRLWPFYVYKKALRDRDKKLAVITYKGEIFYVYVDPTCKGLNKGIIPIRKSVIEAVKIYVGEQKTQILTTYQPHIYKESVQSVPQRNILASFRIIKSILLNNNSRNVNNTAYIFKGFNEYMTSCSN